ncbi:NAD(P)/FAD-dependent oxidoreductase [Amycolatopsis sp. cmx-4-68]|uniref:NAD(P)/FAD-dependent oxidoreductase n=1 Tax=Amycolatopsis sp. cmx-4-68 TaxID=2790938 RepID=UPI00397BCC25
MTVDHYDVVIVGAGPGGLSTATVLGRSRRRALLVDGGAGRNASAAGVHGMLACDGMAPGAVRSAGVKQLAEYSDVEVCRGHVREVAGQQDQFLVKFDSGRIVEARRVVLATGVKEDLPDVLGIAERWGRGVMGCPYCHAWEMRDQPLAVLATGGGVDAMFAAQLTQWSAEITLCTNGSDEIGDEDVLRRRGVSVRTQRVSRVEGPDGSVEQVVFQEGPPLRCAGLFVHATTRQASILPEQLGCAMLDDGSVRVDDAGHTSAPGIYAVGDLARRESSPSGMTFVVSASAMGFVAATTINQELFLKSLDGP